MIARTALISTAAAALLAAAAAPAPAPAQSDAPALKLVSKSLRIDANRRVAVQVRCATSKACKGVIRLKVGNGSDRHPKNYEVAGRRTATIRVGITPTAKRKVMDGATTALVTLTEGERELEKRLPIRIAG